MRRSLFALTLGLTFATVSGSYAEELGAPLSVAIDRARALPLAKPAAGVAVGNPQVLAVTIQNDHLLFLTGRAVGMTNVVVVDADGRVMLDREVQVTANEGGSVVLVRGAEVIRHDCTPICAPAAAGAAASAPAPGGK